MFEFQQTTQPPARLAIIPPKVCLAIFPPFFYFFCLLSLCDSLWRFFSSNLFVSRYHTGTFLFPFFILLVFCFIAFALVFSNVFYSTSFFSFLGAKLFIFLQFSH
jgi:hypothetical protein